jgi:hypothetical protein
VITCPCRDERPAECLIHNHPDHFLHKQVGDTTYGWWARRRLRWQAWWLSRWHWG